MLRRAALVAAAAGLFTAAPTAIGLATDAPATAAGLFTAAPTVVGLATAAPTAAGLFTAAPTVVGLATAAPATAAATPALAPAAAAATADPVPTPTAPTPTSSAASPQAPDPNPPLGGVGVDGSTPGGVALRNRGLIVPVGATALPAGVTAAGFVLVDLDRGTVLAARDPHGRYQPASVQKLLTALVLLPRLAGTTAIPISEGAAATEGSAVGLAPGGAYTADILFTAMLTMSGNDATEALTDAAGGDAAVVDAMNAEARSLGGYDTVAQTPTGLDGWSQLTSAYDLALVLRASVADQRLLGYDQTRRAFLPAQTVLKDGRPVGQIELDNQSSDFLDGYSGALLAKTGFTDAARHTFVGAARRDGRTLGVVMLRAERAPTDQWQQAASLLDWGWALPATTPPVGTLDTPAGPAPTATAAAPTSSAAGASGSSSAPAPTSSAATTPSAAPTMSARTVSARTRDGLGGGPTVYLAGLVALGVGLTAVEVSGRRRAVGRRRVRSRR